MAFFVYATVYCVIDAFRKKRDRRFAWVALVVCLPVIGAYIYVEWFLRSDTHGDFENPNQVDLSVALASANTGWRRLGAAFVDFVIVMAVIGGYTRGFGEETGGVLQVRGLEAGLVVLSAWLVVFPFTEYVLQATVGKKLLGLAVVMEDGKRIAMSSALKRHLLDVVDLVLVSWLVPMIWSEKSAPPRLGDRWAHTRVVMKKMLTLQSPPRTLQV